MLKAWDPERACPVRMQINNEANLRRKGLSHASKGWFQRVEEGGTPGQRARRQDNGWLVTAQRAGRVE